MNAKIVALEVFVLRAPATGRPHWVSHFSVATANEILVRLRTNDGVEGFGLATSYASAEPIVQAFHAGVGEQVLGMDPLAPERLHEKLFALTSGRLAHEKDAMGQRRDSCKIVASINLQLTEPPNAETPRQQ
jgi:L-alanine-DL-glutamate epimerase-like enolase superfamily enzyme